MEIYGYKRSSFWTFLTWIAIVGTAFLLRIVFFWKPHWMLYSTHKQCSLSCADKVLLIDKFNQYYVEDVHQFVLAKCSFAKLLFQQRRIEPDIAGQDLIVGDGGDLKSDGKDSNRRNLGQFSRKAQTYGSFISRCSKASSKKSAVFQVNPETMSGEQVEISLGNYTETKVDDSSMLVDADLDITNNTSINDKVAINYDGGDCNDAEAKFNISFTGTDNSSINNKTFKDENNNAITVRYFDNKKLRYIWDEQKQNFIILRGLDYNVELDKLKKMSKGLSRQEQFSRQMLFGSNTIFVEVQTYIKILFEEVLGPFYIFQLFSVLLWFNDDYDYYATCIVIMSLVSLISSVIQIRSNQQQLRDAVKSTGTVKVKRGKDEYEEIDSSLLVPGDIVVVPTFDTLLQFDALLITGNVIVNESMLTGESVPVTKTPMPFESNAHIKPRHLLTTENFDKTNDVDADDTHDTATVENYYDQKEHSKHTLFCGTKVIQTRYYGGANVMALVLRTGFQTTKGELIRSIMFPKPVDFKFNNQIHKFIGMLACCAMIGFIYTVFLKADRGSSLKEIMLSALDLITITVPPALPAAMTIGIIYAQSRLKKKKIYCISPRSINISGCINCVCFDKTGTLTEDDLSFNEVIPLIENKRRFGKPFDEEVLQSCHDPTIAKNNQLMLNNGNYSPLMHCLASCHSLTKIDEKIIGDPLDLQMFEATGWILEEPDVDDENKFDLLAPTILKPKKKSAASNFTDEAQNSASRSSSPENQVKHLDYNNQQTSTHRNQDIGVLRQFPFSSSFQRMSVVTRQLNVNQFVVYSKGAPEKIASLCDPKTIPSDFLDVLHEYTRKGFRVIALAYRPLKPGISYTKMQRASRATLEKDLNFLGLLTLGNLLKAETESVIDTLTKAAIRTIMVTGDNMQTAISVANDCGMILPFDRTVLLEVKAINEHHIELNKLQASKHSSTTNTRLVSNTKSPPLVLSVDDVAGQFDNESEPILSKMSESSASKQVPRPELTWKYVSNGSDFAPMCMKSSDSVMLKLSDNNRLHLALTGDTFEAVINHYPELLDSVCVRGTVFARMSPNQKQQLVEHLQSLQYYVGMCGDGANDSGALRAAHAGISLSDTEASVAAPFTSANPNISCVPALIIEGRAALVTAFSILKYMALYSLAQFCSVILLYTVYSNFSDFQFMYEDMFIIAVIIASFGRTEPYPELARKPPSSSLLSMTQISSCLIQLVLVAIFQGLVCVLLWNEPWYVEHKPDYDHNFNTQDNYAIFFMSSFQCITLAIVFSKAKPYKKSILSNCKYLSSAHIDLVVRPFPNSSIRFKTQTHLQYRSL